MSFAMCVSLAVSNHMCWIQPTNYGTVTNIHDALLAHGGLNKVNLVISNKIEEASGDGSLENMKQVPFALGTTYEKAKVSIKYSECGYLVRHW